MTIACLRRGSSIWKPGGLNITLNYRGRRHSHDLAEGGRQADDEEEDGKPLSFWRRVQVAVTSVELLFFRRRALRIGWTEAPSAARQRLQHRCVRAGSGSRPLLEEADTDRPEARAAFEALGTTDFVVVIKALRDAATPIPFPASSDNSPLSEPLTGAAGNLAGRQRRCSPSRKWSFR